VSLPWADHQFPSIQIGSLSAYARKFGFEVDTLHLHLEVASYFGLCEYDDIVYIDPHVSELFFATFLYPNIKKRILKHLSQYVSNVESNLSRLSKAIKTIYKNTNWKKYDLVGFTVNPQQLFSSILFAKWLRKDFPHLKILFGGPLVTGKLGIDLLKCHPEVDWCVDGEGETAFVGLLKDLSYEAKGAIKHIPGLIYRRGDQFLINPRRQLLSLKGLPDPDYDHYFRLLDRHPLLQNKEVMPFLLIESSRGCPYRCAFCMINSYWDGYRIRPPKEVSDQMKRMSERYHINRFRIADSNVPIKSDMQPFSSISKHNCDYNLFFEFRADVNKKELKKMRSAGVCKILMGIEALSTNLLSKMNKKTRFIDNLQAMKYCEELGIEHMSNLMLGLPTESQADIDESVRNIEYACAYRPPFRIINFRLGEGAPIFSEPDAYGISDIKNALPFIKNAPCVLKQYDSSNNRRNYRIFYNRYNKWKDEYERSIIDNIKLLSYYDFKSFLKIEDNRSKIGANGRKIEVVSGIKLAGYARRLYLFCDSIKELPEIKNSFNAVDEIELKKLLNKLVSLKLMYNEGVSYLSLAIHARNSIR